MSEPELKDWSHLNGEKVLLGLSAGINSAAVLCQIKELSIQPSELHLFYAHFKEHSPDSFRFVADCVRFAKKNFKKVFFKIERHSILKWFEENKMIPHPASSPCSRILKIERINKYAFEKGIRIDLVGYVKHELKRRAGKQQKNKNTDLFSLDKQYPVGEFTDEWCFEIVERNIGWYPKLYTLMWDDPDFVKWLNLNFLFWPPAIALDIKNRIGNPENTIEEAHGKVVKVISWEMRENILHVCHTSEIDKDDPFNDFIHIKYFLPSTLEEYNNYINSKK